MLRREQKINGQGPGVKEYARMDLKTVYETLEKQENGAEMITAIKAEITKLNGEAKAHREKGDKTAAKTKAILEGLGLDDTDDVADKVKELKATLDSFSQGGKAPSEVAKQITDLTKQVATLTKQYTDMSKTAEAEKAKRFEAMKQGALIDELTKGKAAAPKDMAAMIAGNLFVNEKEQLMYKNGEEILSVADGVKSWLDSHPWAVKVEGSAGSGAPAGNTKDADPFLAGFDK